ncbi:MAG: (2Fe-2S)-binding protein [Planctomycetes bacterium]|nr:(2Fe-2S)-binding protein [Planctomycetota bacterium]
MNPDDHVCLCFHVSQRKIVNYCKRERPSHVSLISECLSAGTGCGWCVPFIIKLHDQVMSGAENPDLPVSPEEYARKRARYRKTGEREQVPAADPAKPEA